MFCDHHADQNRTVDPNSSTRTNALRGDRPTRPPDAARQSRSAAPIARRKRMMALGLAATLAIPAGVFQFGLPSTARAADPIAAAMEMAPAMSAPDRLRLGVKQYSDGQYEEAVATLGQVSTADLTPKDQQLLTETLGKASSASDARKAARAEFELGEQALQDNKPMIAIGHYKSAADSKFIDEGTKAKAREQIVLAEAAQKRQKEELNGTYGSAVRDYRAGNYADAKTKFEQLSAAGFKKPGLFDKSVGDYLKDVNGKLAAADKAAIVPPAVVVPPVVVDKGASDQAVADKPMADTAAADKAAADKAAADKAAADQAAMAPPVVSTTGAVPDTTAAAEPTPGASTAESVSTPMVEPTVSAKDAYKLARGQYRSGDWIAARQNFMIAQQGGYKPGMFEGDAPSKYLARMDRKEQADADQHARELAAAAPVAPVVEATPTTGSGVTATPNAEQDLARTAEADKIKQVQAKFEAQQLVERAKAARDANKLDEAMALYSQAADRDPSNTDATSGKRELQGITGRAPGQSNLLDQETTRIRARRGAINYSFDTAIEDTNRSIAANQFSEGKAALERARVARATDPGLFTTDELRVLDQKISDTSTALAQAELTAATATNEQQGEAIKKEIERRRIEKEQQERTTIATLIKQSRDFVAQRRYQEAMGAIDQILVIDPNNDYALGVRPLVQDRAQISVQRKYRETYDRQFTEVMNEAEEAKIPYSDILRYPDNWPDLSEKRDISTAAERGEKSEDTQVLAQLDKKLPELKFDAVPFADVVEFLRDVTSANIFVNWRALETAGIDKNAPVTARLRDIKFSKALHIILDDVGGGTVKLGYTIDEGVITISTDEDLAKNVATRVYDISDLITSVPNIGQPPEFSLNSQQGGGSRTGGSGGGGGGGSGGSGATFSGGGQQGQQDQGADRTALVQEIVHLITGTVATDTWKDNGGSIGSVSELNGQLVVTQTPENQRALVKLLTQLRETSAIQVTIETRFLTVDRHFLEDVGVDFDFTFNNANPNDPNRKFSPISVSQDSFNAAKADTGQGTLNFTNPALSTALTFMDDFQATLLIRATQASTSATQVTAPRVTVFSGYPAYVLVSLQQNYISDLTPVVGQGAFAFDPTISTLQTGVILYVRPTVSADRKYVRMELSPSLSTNGGFDTFTFPGGAAGGVGNDTTATSQSTAVGTLRLPRLVITQVRTTVSVPDGGTLLLGGQTIAAEAESETGVPILSKIPFVKRLFTNRSTAKDDHVLLILVKPTIIIQREREQEQFPLINSRAAGQ